ncbi:hypothetical protein BK654_09815 [Pseudomonas brassicacearum]|uniref:hypothetical protein n=1 Tax=Pseudomonas brassicacearum TaxID=930166 RepID=UPI000F4AB454|nr:hypothetical protein [Pseudomonas brassicacearum]ROM78266.1 hypothetical protein BK654_09815 [Pseudomonas brassicacearum]
MAAGEYKKLEGMNLEFVSGMLEANGGERAISCSFTFDMTLDFTRFVKMANGYIPGYLEHDINAIRPELDGLAYHVSYNYFADAAGNIGSNEALFRVFGHPDYYLNDWSSGGLEKRYGKPAFQIIDGRLRINARTDFRWEDPKQLIEIADLPIIQFQWALNLMEGHWSLPERPSSDIKAPSTVAVLMYANEDLIEAEGLQIFRGTRYLRGRALDFGPIKPEQILTAQ